MKTAEDILRERLQEVEIANWPQDDDGDPLDMENLHVINVTDAGVEFCCGGSWQEPMRLLIKPDLTCEVLERGFFVDRFGLPVLLDDWFRNEIDEKT